MATSPEQVLQAIEGIANFILRYAVTLAALGALTVGIQEAYKKVFSSLARFHRRALLCWLMQPQAAAGTFRTQLGATLASGGHYALPATAAAGDGYQPDRAYAELMHLTVGVEPGESGIEQALNAPLRRNVTRALFELDLARMMAQVQEAADAALSFPDRHPHWFDFLTSGCHPRDVQAWRHAMQRDGSPTLPREALADIHARMRLLVRRRLDSFQTVTGFRWAEWNQFWGWALGAVLLFVAQSLAKEPPALPWMLATSLAGGILAPVMKDLVDALGKVKKSG